MPVKISLCIITLNEEANLRRCLQSAAGTVQEIIVVDSGSTDGTRKIAEEFGARFEVHAWRGYAEQKNLALSLASLPWILSLDADEALSPRLKEEIEQLEETPEVAGYSMPRCVRFEGKWIRHGDWYPDRLVRLFRNGKARFGGGRVHERLEVDGPIARLRNDIEHYSFRDAADHAGRGEKYAKLWVESQLDAGRRAGPLAAPLRAGYKFVRGYFLRGGFLDGGTGFGIAWRNAREVYLKYQLLEIESSRRDAALRP